MTDLDAIEQAHALTDRPAFPSWRSGRLVDYVLKEGINAGQARPALIVVWHGDGTANLQVFTDGAERGGNDGLQQVMWVEKVPLDQEGRAHGTYHYA